MAFTNFYQPIQWDFRQKSTVQEEMEKTVSRFVEAAQRNKQLEISQQQADTQAQESQAAAQERAQKAEQMRQKAQEAVKAKEIQMQVQKETQEWSAQNPDKSVYARGMWAAKRSGELGDLKTLKSTQDTLIKKMDAVKSLPELNEIREALEMKPLTQKDWENTRTPANAMIGGRSMNLKTGQENVPELADKALADQQTREMEKARAQSSLIEGRQIREGERDFNRAIGLKQTPTAKDADQQQARVELDNLVSTLKNVDGSPRPMTQEEQIRAADLSDRAGATNLFKVLTGKEAAKPGLSEAVRMNIGMFPGGVDKRNLSRIDHTLANIPMTPTERQILMTMRRDYAKQESKDGGAIPIDLATEIAQSTNIQELRQMQLMSEDPNVRKAAEDQIKLVQKQYGAPVDMEAIEEMANRNLATGEKPAFGRSPEAVKAAYYKLTAAKRKERGDTLGAMRDRQLSVDAYGKALAATQKALSSLRSIDQQTLDGTQRVMTLAKKIIGRTGVPYADAIKMKFDSGVMANVGVNTLRQEIVRLSNDVAKATSGGGAGSPVPESQLKLWQSMLNESQTVEMLTDSINSILADIKSRRTGYENEMNTLRDNIRTMADAQNPGQTYPPAPADPKQRVLKKVYDTRIGPRRWTGTGWLKP
jgi:hypothetical protein